MGSLFDKGSSSSGSSSSTEHSQSQTVTDLFQSEQFKNLLGGADKWLEAGGLGQQSNLSGGMGALLSSIGGKYMDVLSGRQDDKALQNVLQSQADAAQQTLERNILPSIGATSNMTGGSAGSRRGIAEGLAASDMSNQLLQQQQQSIANWEQQQTANQMNAAQGLGGMFGQIGQLQENMNANSQGAQALNNLLAYQQLISGNMGGTTSTESSGSSSSSSNSNTSQGGLISNIIGTGKNWFSDEKLKKNIKKVKVNGKKLKTKDGIDIADWEWNEKGEKLGLKGKARGVIAQEAEKVRPDAVTKDKKAGAKKVNYGALM